MSAAPSVIPSRRGFLKTAAAGCWLVSVCRSAAARRAIRAVTGSASPDSKVNAWIHIAPDDSVTLMIHKSEMGQGTVTSLSQLLAEELECDWKRVRTEFPGIDPAFGLQGVFGSQSIRSGWGPLRNAGAQAREMLFTAAAQRWNIDKSLCRASDGVISNSANSKTLTFGQVAEAASKLTPPTSVTLKNPAPVQAHRQADQAPRYAGQSHRPDEISGSMCACPAWFTPLSRAARYSAAKW